MGNVSLVEIIMEPIKSRVTTQYSADVTVVTLNDEEILEEQQIKEIEEELMTIIDDAKCENMLLNFENVEFMTSAFLGFLVKIYKRIRERGGTLELCNINRNISKVFEITQLNKIFIIH